MTKLEKIELAAKQLQKTLEDIFSETGKDFVPVDVVRSRAGLDNMPHLDFGRMCVKLGHINETMIVSGHGFLQEYQEMYNRQAADNIPQIYFPDGFENYDIGGGCLGVFCRSTLKG